MAGEAEEQKLSELEGRYRTKRRSVRQGCEEEELVKALGGRLVTRQGSRSAFDVLNTTLYRVQCLAKDVLVIDEVDLVSHTFMTSFLADAGLLQLP